jgi:hypothetical protein
MEHLLNLSSIQNKFFISLEKNLVVFETKLTRISQNLDYIKEVLQNKEKSQLSSKTLTNKAKKVISEKKKNNFLNGSSRFINLNNDKLIPKEKSKNDSVAKNKNDSIEKVFFQATKLVQNNLKEIFLNNFDQMLKEKSILTTKEKNVSDKIQNLISFKNEINDKATYKETKILEDETKILENETKILENEKKLLIINTINESANESKDGNENVKVNETNLNEKKTIDKHSKCKENYQKLRENLEKFQKNTKNNSGTMKNQFLMNNIFDSYGNYSPICNTCLRKVFKFHPNKLSKLRKKKKDITIKLHGLQGKLSNNSKLETRNQFVDFLKENCVVNGRKKGITHFYLPEFTSFYIPNKKIMEKLENEEKERILLFKFNELQKSKSLKTISNATAKKTKKKYHNFCKIMPHKSDYCPCCSIFYKNHTSFIQQIKLKKFHNLFNEINELEEEKTKNLQNWKIHKEEATKEVNYYKQLIEKNYKDFEIINKNLDKENLKKEFSLVISADFQQAKLLPAFNKSNQPGTTYFKRKFLYNIFGLTPHFENFENENYKNVTEIYAINEFCGEFFFFF